MNTETEMPTTVPFSTNWWDDVEIDGVWTSSRSDHLVQLERLVTRAEELSKKTKTVNVTKKKSGFALFIKKIEA